MKKSELETGMIVEREDGSTGLVIGNAIVGEWGGTGFGDLNDNFIGGSSNIIKVYSAPKNWAGGSLSFFMSKSSKCYWGSMIWERKPEKLITVDGKEYSESSLKMMIQAYVK